MRRVGCRSFPVILIDVQDVRIVQERKAIERDGLHRRVLVPVVVILQITLELEPQQAFDVSLRTGNHEVVLLCTGDLIQDKAGAPYIPERRVDPDRNNWQFL